MSENAKEVVLEMRGITKVYDRQRHSAVRQTGKLMLAPCDGAVQIIGDQIIKERIQLLHCRCHDVRRDLGIVGLQLFGLIEVNADGSIRTACP